MLANIVLGTKGEIRIATYLTRVNSSCQEQVARVLVPRKKVRTHGTHELGVALHGGSIHGSSPNAKKVRWDVVHTRKRADGCLPRWINPGVKGQLSLTGCLPKGIVKHEPTTIDEGGGTVQPLADAIFLVGLCCPKAMLHADLMWIGPYDQYLRRGVVLPHAGMNKLKQQVIAKVLRTKPPVHHHSDRRSSKGPHRANSYGISIREKRLQHLVGTWKVVERTLLSLMGGRIAQRVLLK